ncbi:unnamed protein product, partial [Symbiodinium sp. KB8]
MWHQVMQGPTALLARIATSGKSVITHAEPIPQEELSTCMTACADSCLLSTGFRVTGDDQKRQLCAASTFTCDIRDASTQQEPEAIGVVHRTLASLRDVSGMCIIMRESITTTQPVAEDQMITYSSTISALNRAGQWQKALQLLAECSAAQWRADVILYSSAVSSCEKA